LDFNTTSTYQYSATTLRPTLETISYDLNRDGTPELTRQLDRTHDNLRRPTGFTLKDGSTTETAASYGYDPYSRLAQISNPQISNQIFNYSYLQNSNLLAQVTGPIHTVTNTWELDRDVLDAKENKVGTVSVSKLDYDVNAIGQRTALSQTGTAFASVRGIAWAYDTYGQVTSADSTLATQDRAYQYDAIGNRKKSADSLTLPVIDNYTTNSLNQYNSRSVGVSPTLNPIYDLDGNATSYPLPVLPNANSTLTYDSENRLTSTTVNGITTSQQFDATGRRISKTTGTTTRLYLYEGWNVIAEYSRSVGVSPTLQKTYLWGTDLSGTLQGAGGVGGLLCESNISNPLSPISYPTYDGNGNISEYLTPTGAVAAHFEYDPFGNTVINTDTTNQFTYKFSTKPQDVETGLYYYGYRFYDPVAGRWINRDPIGEKGGSNIYKILYNNTIDKFDVLGMFEYPPSYPGYNPEPPKPPAVPPIPTPSWPRDNLVAPPEINGYQEWFDLYFSARIETWKKFASMEISSSVDCSTKPNLVNGYSQVDGIGFSGGLFSVRIATEPTIVIKWQNCDWSWSATVSVWNTFGSNGGNILEDIARPIVPGVEIPVGSWSISGSGKCK
jgi:RHS repeat-associated protein